MCTCLHLSGWAVEFDVFAKPPGWWALIVTSTGRQQLSTPLNRYSASAKGSPLTLLNTTNKNVDNPISSTSRVPYNHFLRFQYIFHWKKWLHGELMMNSRLVKPTSVRIQLRMPSGLVKNDLMLDIIVAIVIHQIWRDFELHMVLVVDKHKRVSYKREI